MFWNREECSFKSCESWFTLALLGHFDASLPEVIQQATAFMTACYGQKNSETMSIARVNAWAAKTGKGYVSTPKLCTLPPTSESFVENVKRAHYQAGLWRALKNSDPPRFDVENFGWKRDKVNKILVPMTIPDKVNLAPSTILQLIRCGCATATPCSSSRCSCRSASLPCTVFCACHDGCCGNLETS